MFEMELEGEYELEGEWESELEGEEEAEEFLGRLAGLARRAVQSPTLRRVGLAAARSALRGMGSLGGAVGGALGGRSGARLGRSIGSFVGGQLRRRLPQREFEGEFESEYEYELEGEYEGEFEGEGEFELSPIRRVYPDALMEHLGHAAASAESEAEAEAFVGALVPLAARLVPRVAPAIMRAAPGLIRGAANVVRTLRRSPTLRPLVRAVPTIVRRTVGSVARRVAHGRPITPTGIVRTLAGQTARVLSSPRRCARAIQRNRVVDHRYHRVAPAATAARPIPLIAARPATTMVAAPVMAAPAMAAACPCRH